MVEFENSESRGTASFAYGEGSGCGYSQTDTGDRIRLNRAFERNSHGIRSVSKPLKKTSWIPVGDYASVVSVIPHDRLLVCQSTW